MFKTIMFDLDGTLLPMDVDVFFESYMRLLSPRFMHLIPPRDFAKQLLASTEAMVRDNNSLLTNEQVFKDDFFKRIGAELEDVWPVFMDFYGGQFTELRNAVQPNPLIGKIIEALFEKGYEIVIATNPIFPEIAIRERLKWVGIEHLPFKLVTTMEEMHFCKPNPAYFAEILERIGRNADECLMVGNDVEEDLVARKLGIKTYLIKDCIICRGDGYETDYEGSLRDFAEFMGCEAELK